MTDSIITFLEEALPGITECLDGEPKEIEFDSGDRVLGAEGWCEKISQWHSSNQQYLYIIKHGIFELVEEPTYIHPLLTANTEDELERHRLDKVVNKSSIHYKDELHKLYDATTPIRVCHEGDIIGLFSILDNVLFRTLQSRPGENWSIYSGNVSHVYLGNNCEGATYDKDKEDDMLAEAKKYFHTKRSDILFGKEKSLAIKNSLILLPINLNKTRDQPSVWIKLLETAWTQAYQYRASQNSFNQKAFNEYLVAVKKKTKAIENNPFISKSHTERDENGDPIKDNNGKDVKIIERGALVGVANKDFQKHYINAVYDTLNRPLREVPNFLLPKEKTIESTRCLPVMPNSLEDGATFFYPIDYHNYYLHVRYIEDTIAGSSLGEGIFGKIGKLDLVEEAKRVSALERYTTILINVFFSNYKTATKCANYPKGANYPWDVVFKKVEGEGQHMFILTFTKN